MNSFASIEISNLRNRGLRTRGSKTSISNQGHQGSGPGHPKGHSGPEGQKNLQRSKPKERSRRLNVVPSSVPRSNQTHKSQQQFPTGASPRTTAVPAVATGVAGSEAAYTEFNIGRVSDVNKSSHVEQSTAKVALFYWTGWESPILHYTSSGMGGEWTETAFSFPEERAGEWRSVNLEVLVGESNDPLLEFTVTDGHGNWDHQPGSDGRNYKIYEAGMHVLLNGQCRQAPPVEPFLVVSDLDGTMVGEDESTLMFKRYWYTLAKARGCKLVYSSGRSLAQFQTLVMEKRDVLPHPDIYISSVGTKVYHWEEHSPALKALGRSDVSGVWVEDERWSKRLDAGWDVERVREAADEVIAAYPEAVHYRPEVEMHEHKITLGLKANKLNKVQGLLAKSFVASETATKFISSGTGDWKYLDIVPPRAGKLESLDYVRRQLGFPRSRTVACGDSGNDIMMLAGENLGIVVANAQEDLLEFMELRDDTICSVGVRCGECVVAEREVAYGILEGLQTLALDPHLGSIDEWLPQAEIHLPDVTD